MSTEAQTVAPPVVAVVVTHDAGPWLETTLAALRDQDYPNLSVLVVDNGSTEDPTARVATVLPGAYVRRLPEDRGFAAAANEVLRVVEGASHFLVCHDDVAPDPDAVRLLVEEAFRSNAGLVAPKLVDWEAPERLLQVGLSIDKSGAPALLVEPGELDQEQHDAVRDVFVAPGGCTLVRADLFATLGGFDEAMYLYGEDLDLSWRAQVAGARVIVAPGARVRHLEAMSSGRRGVADLEELRRTVRPLQLRHRLRAVLKNYSTFHLVRVLPQAALLAAGELVYGLLTGRVGTSRDILGAWRWNLAHRAELRAARKAVKRIRTLPDSEVRPLQARGSARATAFVRGQLAADGRLRRRAPHLPRPAVAAGPGQDGNLRLPLVVVGVLAVVLLLGSRHLLGGRLAAVGEFAPFPEGPWTLLRTFLSESRAAGLGSAAPVPTAVALVGLLGTVLLGAMGVAQKLLVLGMLPLGLVGAFRLAKPLGSRRARLAAVVVYAAVPVPYNALARGRWSALLLYGALPWVTARLLRASGVEPFGTAEDREAGLGRHLLPLVVVVALLTAFVPVAPVIVVLVAVALFAGGRPVVLAVATAGATFLLLFPWSLDFVLPGSQWATVAGVDVGAGQGPPLGALLRFETGPLGAPPLGWAFLVVAALPMLVAQGWRLSWAARAWALAVSCWTVAWVGGRDWVPFSLPSPDVLVVPAALALALAAALGVAAFEADLPRYRFGWRQGVSLVAAAAAMVGAVPVVVATVDGRWHQPERDYGGLLSWMGEQRSQGDFRVLWLGDPGALPIDGWQLREGVAYATSDGGPPRLLDRWPPASPGDAAVVGEAVEVAFAGGTTELGDLLAPALVRYVVVPSRPAPVRDRVPHLPPPAGAVAALDAQVDLRQLESDESLRVYENEAWPEGRAELREGRYRTSVFRAAAVAIEVALWAVVVRALVRRRPEEEEAG
jgi:GT2 family glycosyltransferase